MKRSQFRGRYKPRNPDKYTGNVHQIIWRSSWERLFMMYCDKSPNILQWSSEEVSIPYNFKDKNRNYYPDFWIKMVDEDNEVVEKLIEIKPHYQRRWSQNVAKWHEAKKYCNENNLEFVVLTEKELF